jgi:hypothetical protein
MSSMGMVMKWMVDGQANTPITESMSVTAMFRQLPFAKATIL